MCSSFNAGTSNKVNSFQNMNTIIVFHLLILNSSISSYSKHCSTPRTRLIKCKCFVLITLCCKTKHLRSLVQVIVRDFEWLEVLAFSFKKWSRLQDFIISCLHAKEKFCTEVAYCLTFGYFHFTHIWRLAITTFVSSCSFDSRPGNQTWVTLISNVKH